MRGLFVVKSPSNQWLSRRANGQADKAGLPPSSLKGELETVTAQQQSNRSHPAGMSWHDCIKTLYIHVAAGSGPWVIDNQVSCLGFFKVREVRIQLSNTQHSLGLWWRSFESHLVPDIAKFDLSAGHAKMLAMPKIPPR